MSRRFPLFCVIAWFCIGLQVAVFGWNVCWSQLSWEEVVVFGGNDCRETDVLFDKPFLRMREGEVVSNICFFSHHGRKRSKYKKQAPASFKLTLNIGLIKQYFSLFAVISPQNSHLFPRKLRPANISPKCCYLKPHKIMQLHKTKETFSTSR